MTRDTIASLRNRAEAAEQSLAAHEQATRATLEAMAKRAADRAALMNIELKGRVLRFTFVRAGGVVHIECMGTWDDDVAGWKRMLLEPITGETWSVEINPKSWAENET